MTKETRSFVLRLAGFTAILFLIHFYIINQFFHGQLYFPIWSIHLFNAVLVLIVYSIIVYRINQGTRKIYQLFLGLTIVKMIFAVIFLFALIFWQIRACTVGSCQFFCPLFSVFGIRNFKPE